MAFIGKLIPWPDRFLSTDRYGDQPDPGVLEYLEEIAAAPIIRPLLGADSDASRPPIPI
jgi:hypothetical protein